MLHRCVRKNVRMFDARVLVWAYFNAAEFCWRGAGVGCEQPEPQRTANLLVAACEGGA